MENCTKLIKNKPRNRCIFKCGPGEGIGCHAFPLKNTKLMGQWIDAVGIQSLPKIRNLFLCSRHFEKKFLRYINGKCCLTELAVPTIFNMTNKAPDEPRILEQLNVDNCKPIEIETCRACFTITSDKFQSLWDTPNLLAVFEKCSYLKVEKNDGLPQTLCSSCAINCFSWFNFYELCSQTEALIKKMNKDKDPSSGGSSNNINTLPEWEEQIPVNNANKNPIGISNYEVESGNYVVYKFDSSDSENKQNTNLTDDNILPEIDVKDKIEKLICLPTVFTPAQISEETEAEDDDLIVDKRIIDKAPLKKTLSCNSCGEIFINGIMLKRHMSKCYSRNRQRKKEKPFKCNICDRRFVKKSNFFEHKQRHKEEKPAVSVESSPVPIQIFTALLGAKATPVVIAAVPVKTLSSSVGTPGTSVISPPAQVQTSANPVEAPTVSSKTSTQIYPSTDLGKTTAASVEKSGAQIETYGTSAKTSLAPI